MRYDFKARKLSKEKPVIFKLDNVIYEVEITMARGGYELACKEIK